MKYLTAIVEATGPLAVLLLNDDMKDFVQATAYLNSNPTKTVKVTGTGYASLSCTEYGEKYSVYCMLFDTEIGTYYLPYKGHAEFGDAGSISLAFCKELVRNYKIT